MTHFAAITKAITPWHLWQVEFRETQEESTENQVLFHFLSPSVVSRQMAQMSSLPRHSYSQCEDYRRHCAQLWNKHRLCHTAPSLPRLVGILWLLATSPTNHRLPSTTRVAEVGARTWGRQRFKKHRLSPKFFLNMTSLHFFPTLSFFSNFWNISIFTFRAHVFHLSIFDKNS